MYIRLVMKVFLKFEYPETNKLNICLDCDARLSFQKKLEKHVPYHAGERNYTCGKCEKVFTQNFRLKVHIAKHTVDRLFLCLKCGKPFTTRQHLTKHNKLHISSKFSLNAHKVMLNTADRLT